MSIIKNICVPKETVSDEFSTVVNIHVKNGDKVKNGDSLVDLETSKTVISIYSDCEGYVQLLCSLGEDVKINSPLMNIVSDLNEISNNNIIEENGNNEIVGTYETIYSLNAIKLIEEYKLEKTKFNKFDFVSKFDVLQFVNPQSQKEEICNNSKNEIFTNNSILIDNNKIYSVDLPRTKKVEIDYLSDVQSSDLTSSMTIEIDVSKLSNYIYANHKYFKFSVAPTVISIVSKLLKKYKNFNSFYRTGKINYYNDINVGYATDGDYGLKVLTTYNTDSMTLNSLDTRLYELVMKYRQNNLLVDDITNSTFTISDLSSEGITTFTPLINAKQSAILGISSVNLKTEIMILSFTFDHRISSGKEASSFLREIKNEIEELEFKENEQIEEQLILNNENTNNENKKGKKMNQNIQEAFEQMGQILPELTTNFFKMTEENMRDKYIDVKTKKLVLIGIAVFSQCTWCIEHHIASALEMGISENEIVEAASQAIIMGGGPKMMYMNVVMNTLNNLRNKG